MSAPSLFLVLVSAWRSASLRFVGVRPSSRAFSGSVAEVFFASPAVARAFASAWARRVGVGCVVRFCSLAAPVAGCWVVSVPVAAPVRPLVPGLRSVLPVAFLPSPFAALRRFGVGPRAVVPLW